MENEFLKKIKIRITGLVAVLYIIVHIIFRLTGGKTPSRNNNSTANLLKNTLFELIVVCAKLATFAVFIFILYKVVTQIIY